MPSPAAVVRRYFQLVELLSGARSPLGYQLDRAQIGLGGIPRGHLTGAFEEAKAAGLADAARPLRGVSPEALAVLAVRWRRRQVLNVERRLGPETRTYQRVLQASDEDVAAGLGISAGRVTQLRREAFAAVAAALRELIEG